MKRNAPNFKIEGKPTVKVRALLLSERITVRTLENLKFLDTLPLTFATATGGCVMIFKYGAVVLFEVSTVEEESLMASLKDFLVDPFSVPETEEVEMRIVQDVHEGVQEGIIYLKEANLTNLELIGEVLAKSMVLEHYETGFEQNVEIVESLILNVKRGGYKSLSTRELLQQIVGSLLSLQEMVGFVAVSDKPEVLWEEPQRERFYVRLRDEYEIRERHLILDRKVELIFRTADTLMDLLQTRRSLRVEWYIVFLILVEIFIILYDMFTRAFH